MLRLAKFIKPYLLLIIAAMALLFGQAMADLALPNYMSDIVNVGIQQGGVQSAVPSAIRASEMDRLVLFLTPDEKTVVLADYTLVDKNSADYAATVEKYPAAANEPVYVLKTVDSTELNRLDPLMGKGLLAVSMIEQVMADPSKASSLGLAAGGFDISKLPCRNGSLCTDAETAGRPADRHHIIHRQDFCINGQQTDQPGSSRGSEK